jgi:hypothetical protein
VLTIRKIIIGIVVILLLFVSVLFYNHKQKPTANDVFKITKNWSPGTEEVYLVRKIDGEWLTIFRNHHSIMLGELKQNWFGLWQIRDEAGGESSLASTYYPPEKDDEITWSMSGSGETETVYYFGQLINPEIQKITVKTSVNPAEDVPVIISNENRFFFKKVKGEFLLPADIRGFSKSGELKYSTLPE